MTEPACLRIATYDIHRGRGLDGRERLRRIGAWTGSTTTPWSDWCAGCVHRSRLARVASDHLPAYADLVLRRDRAHGVRA